jgi:8-oxo-dGTP pyrophosphatase MutT (NUDIX family)
VPDEVLRTLLRAYSPADDTEAADITRLDAIVTAGRPWDRATPLHVTASAVIVHPPTSRVLLRWHQRQQAWLQIGGHGDPGEHDPVAVALREGAEETGLPDLTPWPDRSLQHVAVVPVPAKGDDPAHEHADLRFFLVTAEPDAARPEHAGADVRWLSIDDALVLTSEENVRETIRRAARAMERAH